MNIKTRPYEFTNGVDSGEDIETYLAVFLEENGPAGLIRALGQVAKKQGMTEVAKKAGVSRQSLYRTLGEGGNPNFTTVNNVIEALGCRLSIVSR